MRIILSTFGPLHLIKSSEYLSKHVNVIILQGWIPSAKSKWLVSFASIVFKRDLSKTLVKRNISSNIEKNISIFFPEFILRLGWILFPKFKDTVSYKSAIFFGKSTSKYIKSADILHVRSGSGLGGAIEKAKKEGMKVVVDHSIAHTSFIDKQLRDEYAKYNEQFDMGIDSRFWQGVLANCQAADCLLVNSDFVKETFVSNGFDKNRIEVVYLGVREDFLGLKKNYDVNTRLKILFTGSFGFRKGAEYILKALQFLDEINFSYEMNIVGTYNPSSKLLSQINPKNLNFVGHIPQECLKKHFVESDIYLFPSLAEGCASSGMEAMAAGLPIITTLESGLPIKNNQNGIVIPSKNVEEIVNNIVRLSQDKELRLRLGYNASNTIREHYTWEKYANNVVNLYNKLFQL